MSAKSVLAPVSAAAHRNGYLDWYGAVEYDLETGEEVWRFDSTASRFDVAQLVQDGRVVRHRGFRPASVQRLEDGRTLIAGWQRGNVVDENGRLRDTFTHDLLNDAHEIQRTERGTYLAASTGLDTLLEFDDGFEEVWRWHMWEHVDPGTRPPDYYPDQLWYRGQPADLALSPDDRYHLNYATYLNDDEILCSALNYGVFVVDRESGEVVRERTDLDECHNPRRVDDGLVVPESGADRVVRVDWSDETETLFEGGLSFVKDADPMPGDDWLLADTKHDRVLVWAEDEDEPRQSFHLGQDANPYEADVLSGADSFAG